MYFLNLVGLKENKIEMPLDRKVAWLFLPLAVPNNRLQQMEPLTVVQLSIITPSLLLFRLGQPLRHLLVDIGVV